MELEEIPLDSDIGDIRILANLDFYSFPNLFIRFLGLHV